MESLSVGESYDPCQALYQETPEGGMGSPQLQTIKCPRRARPGVGVIGNQTRVPFGELFNSNENAIVNGFPALIVFSSGLINRSTMTMNE